MKRNSIHASIENGPAPEIDYDVTHCTIHSEDVYALTAVRSIDSPQKPKFEIILSLKKKVRHAYLNAD